MMNLLSFQFFLRSTCLSMLLLSFIGCSRPTSISPQPSSPNAQRYGGGPIIITEDLSIYYQQHSAACLNTATYFSLDTYVYEANIGETIMIQRANSPEYTPSGNYIVVAQAYEGSSYLSPTNVENGKKFSLAQDEYVVTAHTLSFVLPENGLSPNKKYRFFIIPWKC